MKIETSDKPIPRGKYDLHLNELKKGKTLIKLNKEAYNGVRQACYRNQLNIYGKKQQDGTYSMRLLTQ